MVEKISASLGVVSDDPRDKDFRILPVIEGLVSERAVK
jgi:hypothetical protein